MASGAFQPDYSNVPRLVIELEPWSRAFFRNLADTLRPWGTKSALTPTANYWPDVFVNQRLPFTALRQSLLYHIFVVVAVWGFTVTYVRRPAIAPPSFTRNQAITYYKLSEYLPAISSPLPPAPIARKGDPEYAKQPIISVPKLPDNKAQTIVDPSTAKVLPREARLPNLVAWNRIPSAPVEVGARSAAQLTLPTPPVAAVAPAAQNASRDISRLAASAPSPTVVRPAPAEEALKRNLGDLNVTHVQPGLMPPKITIPEQHATAPSGPAAPNVQGLSGNAAAQLIALGIHPAAVTGAIPAPGGNRRGEFAATPEGKPGASGRPELTSTSAHSGQSLWNSENLPAGIQVGGPAVEAPVPVVAKPAVPPDAQKKTLLAAMIRPPLTGMPRDIHPPAINHPQGGKLEQEVFGGKRYYSMVLNMPNLTSNGGSWIVRFAELKPNGDPAELTSPVAIQKVDPGYSGELIREHVEGTVVLYAVIHSDGTVGDVRVLRGVDKRLDESARAAISKWQFRPATKHGTPVDTEAVIHIPFTLPRESF
jgi:TonB family protein